jgi:uncharacterized transporter YbjL
MTGHFPVDVALTTLLDGDLVRFPEHTGVAYLAAELRKMRRGGETFRTTSINENVAIARIVSCNPKVIGSSLSAASCKLFQTISSRVLAGGTAEEATSESSAL